MTLPVDQSEVTWLSAVEPALCSDTRDTSLVQRKKFHFPASELAVDFVRLDGVGLSLYSTGQLDATAMVFHNGGPFGDLLGNRIVVTLQAFAGPTTAATPLADSAIVWQREIKAWARRGKRQAIKLGPHTADPVLRRRFNEITHLAVELTIVRDR